MMRLSARGMAATAQYRSSSSDTKPETRLLRRRSFYYQSVASRPGRRWSALISIQRRRGQWARHYQHGVDRYFHSVVADWYGEFSQGSLWTGPRPVDRNNPAAYYFNVHSPLNPGGFSRGQLTRVQ